MIFSCHCMFTILVLYPLGKECGPSFEQTWIRLYRMPSLAEISSLILEEIFKLRPGILAISFLSHLGKRRGPSFKQNWTPFTQGYFVPSLVEIGQIVLEMIFKICLKNKCIFIVWPTTYHLMRTTYYLTRTTYYLKRKTDYLTRTTYFFMRTTYHLMRTTYYLTRTNYYLKRKTDYLTRTTYFFMRTTYYLLDESSNEVFLSPLVCWPLVHPSG